MIAGIPIYLELFGQILRLGSATAAQIKEAAAGWGDPDADTLALLDESDAIAVRIKAKALGVLSEAPPE